jgi:hypothetical protein
VDTSSTTTPGLHRLLIEPPVDLPAAAWSSARGVGTGSSRAPWETRREPVVPVAGETGARSGQQWILRRTFQLFSQGEEPCTDASSLGDRVRRHAVEELVIVRVDQDDEAAQLVVPLGDPHRSVVHHGRIVGLYRGRFPTDSGGVVLVGVVR